MGPINVAIKWKYFKIHTVNGNGKSRRAGFLLIVASYRKINRQVVSERHWPRVAWMFHRFQLRRIRRQFADRDRRGGYPVTAATETRTYEKRPRHRRQRSIIICSVSSCL